MPRRGNSAPAEKGGWARWVQTLRSIHNSPLNYYGKREQRIIVDAIDTFLASDANVPTRRRKQLRHNPLAPWELRVGEYRVFYELWESQRVRVLAIGHKEHNDLLMRGRSVEL